MRFALSRAAAGFIARKQNNEPNGLLSYKNEADSLYTSTRIHSFHDVFPVQVTSFQVNRKSTVQFKGEFNSYRASKAS